MIWPILEARVEIQKYFRSFLVQTKTLLWTFRFLLTFSKLLQKILLHTWIWFEYLFHDITNLMFLFLFFLKKIPWEKHLWDASKIDFWFELITIALTLLKILLHTWIWFDNLFYDMTNLMFLFFFFL